MIRRILKKRCKRAMEVLIAEHGYRPADFQPATGEEAIDAPPGMEARFVRRGWMEPGVLKGTPLWWERYSMCNDADARLPSTLLADLILWSFFRYREGA